ncbi:MAG: hypothetical protein M1133_07975 [Armatimonadetes bacterium]|nr:hypothetical protein [Armatimonadota bacterium]
MQHNRNSILGCGLAAMAGVVFLALVVYQSGATNLHRQIDGMPITRLRITLWDYYVDHRHPPAKLSDTCPQAGASNGLRFGTMQKLSCYLEYMPENAKRGKPIAFVRCGSPVLVEAHLAADGSLISEKWYPYLKWRATIQRHTNYPELSFRKFNNRRVPPPDFDKVIGPFVR